MKFFGELLIFVLLLITNGRVFFKKKARRDPLVALVPFTIILSVLMLFSWGFDLFIAMNILLSILVLFTNFHALFRYGDNLYVDSYSLSMKIGAVLTLVLTIFAIGVTIFFMPVVENPRKPGIAPVEEKLTGSIRNGFTDCGTFDKVNATFYEYSLFPGRSERDYAVIFLPDRRGDVEAYHPYLQLMAENCCTVLTADFYTDDFKYLHNTWDGKIFRHFFMVLNSLTDNQKFMSQREFYTYNVSLEAEALLKRAKEKYGPNCKYFIISDVMGNTAASDLYKKYPEEITGIFELNSIPEYKTAGYGCVEQTDPLLAAVLGTKRDSSLFVTRYMANKSTEAAKTSWGVKIK